MASDPNTPRLLRYAALAAGLGAFALAILGAYRVATTLGPTESFLDGFHRLFGVMAIAVLCVVVAGVLFGMAGAMDRKTARAAPPTDVLEVGELLGGQSAGPTTTDNHAVLQALGSLRKAVEQLATRSPGAANPASTPGQATATGQAPAAGPATAGAAPMAVGATAALQEILTLLRELRDLSLLNDAQRDQRIEILRQERREQFVAESSRQIQAGQWAEADRAIADFERDFGGNDDLAGLKAQLVDGRQQAERKELKELGARVEDLMAIASWDQAQNLAARFAENHPNNADGQELLARVMREREAFVETTANRLYTDIKGDIERRRWRRAAENARKLLEKFPGHRRAATVRAQFKTIEENAEIEKRHEQEHHIQDLIRARQFARAIESAEDLLERFPNASQAQSIRELIPKLRERMSREMEAHADDAKAAPEGV